MTITRKPLLALAASTTLLLSACGSSLQSTTSLPEQEPSTSSTTPSEATPSTSPSPLTTSASASPSPSPSTYQQVIVTIGQDLPFPEHVNSSKPRLTDRIRTEAHTQGVTEADADADDCWYFAGNTLSDGTAIRETLLCPAYKDGAHSWMMLDPNQDYAVQGYFWENPREADSTRLPDIAGSFQQAAGTNYALGTLSEARVKGPDYLYGYVITQR